MRARQALAAWAGVLIGALMLTATADAKPMEEWAIGYTTFDSPRNVRAAKTSTLQSFHAFLQSVVEGSASNARTSTRLEVELFLGNYYQIFTWLRDGQLDGALVSPFMAHLLREQGVAYPVVEFLRHPPASGEPEADGPLAGTDATSRPDEGIFCGDDPTLPNLHHPRGHWPLVAASCRGKPCQDPEREMERFLREVEEEAVRRVQNPSAEPKPSEYQVWLVSHLSATGFLAPVAHAARTPARAFSEQRRPGWSPDTRRRHREAFWEVFFERVRFAFKHTAEPQPEDREKVVLRFSYSDRSRSSLRRDQSEDSHALGCWQPYFTAPGREAPVIPNDVLVLRPSAVYPGLGVAAVAEGMEKPDSLGRLLLKWSGERLDADEDGAGYHAVALPSGETWERFSQTLLAAVDGSPELRRYWGSWFGLGRYSFQPTDLVRFLKQDANTSGKSAAALVLPGGGVKAAYQARLLDHLYNGGYLRNGASVEEEAPGVPLGIHHVLGTSGGAMMGFLAAQIPPGETEDLTARWKKQLTSSSRVFPFFNTLRWLSVLILLYLFSALLDFGVSLEKTAESLEATHPIPQEHSSLRVLLLLAPMILTPPLSAGVLRPENRVTLALVATFYLGILILTHFGLSCVVAHPEGRRPVKPRAQVRWLAVTCLTVGGALVLLALLATVAQLDFLPSELCKDIGSGPERLRCEAEWAPRLQALNQLPGGGSTAEAAFVGLGFLLLQAGGLLWLVRPSQASRPTRGASLVALPLYLRGLAAFAAYLLAVYSLMIITSWIGWTTLLELTGLFWLCLLLFGLLVGVLFLALASPHSRFRPLASLHQGLAYLGQHQVRGFLLTTPKRSLLIVTTLGFLWWGLWLGNGLYSARKAYDTFSQLSTQVVGDWGTDRPIFHTNLVVTTSAFEDSAQDREVSTCPSYPAGASYFCFDGSVGEGCPAVKESRWHRVVIPPPDSPDGTASPGAWQEAILEPIFASGSPFPVFPPYLVDVTEGCRPIPMVDGGFAHLEPLEAGYLLGARQLLVIRSQPDPGALKARRSDSASATYPFPSRLAKGLGNLFPFLFERSQELDKSIGRSMVVAVLAPHPDHGAFPLLTDFRLKVVQRMIDAAEEDWQRPIGTIESWGLPKILERLEPEGGNGSTGGGEAAAAATPGGPATR